MRNEVTDILVVDDNAMLVNVISEIFKECGCLVRTAADGFAALATIRDRVPDVLMSDLHMPRMSGFELLSIVRRRFPAIAVIAMSGAYSGVAVPQGVAADAFYAKGSSSVAQLFEKIRAIKDEATRHSLRVAAPIWIHGLPIDHGCLATIAVACPECLRTFPHRLDDANLLHTECCCPHCDQMMQLAMVRPTADMNQTGFALNHKSLPSVQHHA